MSTDVWGTEPALWQAWVPAGILGGGGIGVILTTLGTTAVGSVPPQQFATGIGMNLTARQTGGALGIAILAAVFAANPDGQLSAFHTVFAVCAGIAFAAAVCASAIPTSPRGEQR